MKRYNRIILGKGNKFAKVCRKDGYIGVNFEVGESFADVLKQHENKSEFIEKFAPEWMKKFPSKTRISASVVCSFIWTVIKGLQIGDIVLCPSGEGYYYYGIIESDYYYKHGESLPHRRKVKWNNNVIYRNSMSKSLQNSTRSIGTCCDITKYAEEIEYLINGKSLEPLQKGNSSKSHVHSFDERSLHKLFCSNLRVNNIYAKTIFHEKSHSKSDSAQKWVHPDIVGVQFQEYKNEATLTLLKATEPKATVHIYSYELKKKIETDYQLKQYYFQALSNSSWANFGYLVAFDINEDLSEEMERLNNAFGIGIIQMQADDYKILHPAREKDLDYNTIEKLNNLNSDFSLFITRLARVMNATKEYTEDAKQSFKSICDEIFKNDIELEQHCKDNNIPF